MRWLLPAVLLWAFFARAHDADVIYGSRTHRDDGWRRVLASLVLKLTLLLAAGVWCVDANVPYRLMHTAILRNKLDSIPPGFFLANVALAVVLRRDPAIRHSATPIRFRERYGGEPSVKISKFGDKALELVKQLRSIK